MLRRHGNLHLDFLCKLLRPRFVVMVRLSRWILCEYIAGHNLKYGFFADPVVDIVESLSPISLDVSVRI